MALERYFLAAWQTVSGVGSAQLTELRQQFGSARVAWGLSAEELLHSRALEPRALAAFLETRRQRPDLPAELADACGAKGISVCSFWEDGYPPLLRQSFRPPAVLFYRGTLCPDKERLAVVGSRRCSPYGRGAAKLLAEAVAKAGITIVSGAARGIDTQSRCGALQAGGRTVAVLGCGPDIVYPSENRRLLDEIAETGVVLSEYAPGTPPLPAFFPARNRIISGLCRGTLVVEAAERSGSLITAELALDNGRDVFAVPGSIFSDTSRGCHRLLQQGAKLVTQPADILEEYGCTSQPPVKAAREALSNEENRIYEVLSIEQPLSMDEIIYKLQGSNTANIAFLLLQMEMKGLVEETAVHSYVRAAKEDNL